MPQDMTFNAKLQPIVNSFQDLIAATLGWPYIVENGLLNLKKLIDLIVSKESVDRMGFKTSFDGDFANISFSFAKHIRPFLSTEFKRNKYLCPIHQILLGQCWEIMKTDYEGVFGKNSLGNHDSPIIQFCRHVRNGSFHSNRFSIRNITKEAKWKTLEIITTDDKKKIFADDSNEFFLNWGDVVPLIYEVSEIVYSDIERKEKGFL